MKGRSRWRKLVPRYIEHDPARDQTFFVVGQLRVLLKFYLHAVAATLVHTTYLMSCTRIVRVDSPDQPRLLDAVTMNRAAGSITGAALSKDIIRSQNNIRLLTHLRDDPAMVSRDNLEGHTRPGSTGRIRFRCFRRIPQPDIVTGRARSSQSVSSFHKILSLQ